MPINHPARCLVAFQRMDALLNEDLPQCGGSFVNASRRDAFAKATRTGTDMSGPTRWFSFRNHDGTLWTVKWASHDSYPDLRGQSGSRGYDGLTEPEEKLITLDAAAFRSTQDHITLHEIMHASVDGVDGVSGKAEENVITAMAPRLYPILHKFGLRWPDRPEGFVALERKARRSSK